MAPVLSIRIDPMHRNHHLWFNHGSWWVHYVLYEDQRRRRVRFSLQTRSVREARRLRDRLFAKLVQQGTGTRPARPARPRPAARRSGARPAPPSPPASGPADGALRLLGPGGQAAPALSVALAPVAPAHRAPACVPASERTHA